MQLPLIIHRNSLTPLEEINRSFKLGRRFAFSICLEGNIDLEILNKRYHFEANSMMICLPYSDVKVLNVSQPTEIIFVELNVENVIGLSASHRSIILNNILLIRRESIVKFDPESIGGIITEIDNFLDEISHLQGQGIDDICFQVRQSLVDSRGQLIISQLLKLYFENIPKHLLTHTNNDAVFQRFLSDVYLNYKEHHNVRFYAMRSGLSVKYFSTLIRELSGASPSEWIESIILCETQLMLLDPHNTIKDIAVKLHFPDAASFTRYVYRLTGLTPKALRKTLT